MQTNTRSQQGVMALEFALVIPIFLALVLFYWQSTLWLWDSMSNLWFFWRASRLESTVLLPTDQLITTLTTNSQGQSILLAQSMTNTHTLSISLINALGQFVQPPSNFSASTNQYNCQNNILVSCYTAIELTLCQNASQACQSLSWQWQSFNFNITVPLTMLSISRPIEAAGGFF
ncbi:MAG: pilus assembly protein [Betaproteobacteria bacterium]|nr:pilus assembly protein [Betaproteobacteria bacterium]